MEQQYCNGNQVAEPLKPSLLFHCPLGSYWFSDTNRPQKGKRRKQQDVNNSYASFKFKNHYLHWNILLQKIIPSTTCQNGCLFTSLVCLLLQIHSVNSLFLPFSTSFSHYLALPKQRDSSQPTHRAVITISTVLSSYSFLYTN